MISRVAECCFWMTRYLERVDTLARLLKVHHALHIDAGLRAERRWRTILGITDQQPDFIARVGDRYLDDGEAVQLYLTWDAQHPSSLYSCVRSVRENARAIRELLSLEAWESINDLWLWLRKRDSQRLYDANRGAFYERVMQSAVLFHGVSHATMMHDEPFSFMKLGRAVERASQTARILDAHETQGGQDGGEAAVAARCLATLRSCCAFEPFFHSTAHLLTGRDVMRFLLFDRSLPRSVLYNLDEARTLLYRLRREDPLGLPRRSRAALERLRGELLQMNVGDVERRGAHTTLRWTIEATDRLCEAIHDDYLAPPTGWLRHCVRVLESLEAPPTTDRAA